MDEKGEQNNWGKCENCHMAHKEQCCEDVEGRRKVFFKLNSSNLSQNYEWSIRISNVQYTWRKCTSHSRQVGLIPEWTSQDFFFFVYKLKQ